jgi:hypothetical protein
MQRSWVLLEQACIILRSGFPYLSFSVVLGIEGCFGIIRY